MYYLMHNGQKTGPYNEQEIRHMLFQGAVGFETKYWGDGMFSWEPLGSSPVFNTRGTAAPANYAARPTQPHAPISPYVAQPVAMYPAVYTSGKSRVTYILLALFLGGLGIHNFYAGYTGKGVAQLLMNLFLFWTIIVPLAIGIWVIVEAITVETDANGYRLA
jgi:TM2 domain-containing membrane protein YozV